MLAALVTAWTIIVKLPLSFLGVALNYRRLSRLRAAYASWAAEAGQGGPGRIARRIRERVTYHPDPLGGVVDYVAAPPLTWDRGRGDCDDFSYLAADVLARAGNLAWIINYWCWDLRSSHTVAAFRDEGGYRVLDQGTISPPYATLGEAARGEGPSAAVAAVAITRYAADWDVVGRWLSYASREREL